MRTGHLFAGAGGGLLADLILGHQPVWAVEWDPYACAILRARFPGLHVVHADIRTVDFRGLAPVDAVCAGFPCTDLSPAGSKKGIHGPASGLYTAVIRAAAEISPSWVFLENTARIESQGRDVVIRDLLALGYAWKDGILSASDVGAPHQRDRWWLLACRLPDPGSYRLEIPEPSGVQPAGCGVRPSWYTSQPPVRGVVDGLAARAHGHWASRISRIGNGQVPLVAALAWVLLGGPADPRILGYLQSLPCPNRSDR